ncbi:MAG: hypothetical protein AB7R40_26305 [Nitrospiraceae bacterium]
MKNIIPCWLVVVLACACSQVSQHNELESGNIYPVAGTGDICLSQAQFRTTLAAAKTGVMAAMKRLYEHYEICTDDRVQMLHWMKSAGHLGDSDARRAAISELRRLRIPDEVSEARALVAEWGLELEWPEK